jgi:hypothetical protein
MRVQEGEGTLETAVVGLKNKERGGAGGVGLLQNQRNGEDQ